MFKQILSYKIARRILYVIIFLALWQTVYVIMRELLTALII